MTSEVIISADSHVFEPIDLWEKRIDKRFRDRGPRYVANWRKLVCTNASRLYGFEVTAAASPA